MTQLQEEPLTGESSVVPALLDMAAGYPLARCLHVAADLGVADVLDGAACTAAELAEAVGVQPDPLERVLRLLSAHGVFEVRDGGFAHTPASRLLRTDHPRSIRAVVRLFGLPPVWASQGALMHSLRTGQVAAEEVQPGGFCGYLAEQSTVSNSAMVQTSQMYLERLSQVQNDRDKGFYVDADLVYDTWLPTFAVDLDFQQALNNGGVDL